MEPIIIVPVAVALLFIAIGYSLARASNWSWLAALVIAAGVVSAFLLLTARGLSGFDGLGYILILMAVSGPALLGLFLGGIVGAGVRWFKARG